MWTKQPSIPIKLCTAPLRDIQLYGPAVLNPAPERNHHLLLRLLYKHRQRNLQHKHCLNVTKLYHKASSNQLEHYNKHQKFLLPPVPICFPSMILFDSHFTIWFNQPFAIIFVTRTLHSGNTILVSIWIMIFEYQLSLTPDSPSESMVSLWKTKKRNRGIFQHFENLNWFWKGHAKK